MTEIRNRVQESGIITMDLADFKPNQAFVGIDLADVLWQGMVLKEADFRAWVKEHDWSKYKSKAVYIHCSVDAIIPTWAYMLIGSKLITEDVPFIVGDQASLERKLIADEINKIDTSEYRDGRIMIKGCSDITDPAFAMSELVRVLQPVAKSIMYGEPCSAVPVFKRK